jgi:hypothetical protein
MGPATTDEATKILRGGAANQSKSSKASSTKSNGCDKVSKRSKEVDEMMPRNFPLCIVFQHRNKEDSRDYKLRSAHVMVDTRSQSCATPNPLAGMWCSTRKLACMVLGMNVSKCHRRVHSHMFPPKGRSHSESDLPAILGVPFQASTALRAVFFSRTHSQHMLHTMRRVILFTLRRFILFSCLCFSPYDALRIATTANIGLLICQIAFYAFYAW